MSPSSHARTALIEGAEASDGVEQCFAATLPRLRRMVPFDASVWLAMDPATSLPSSPTLLHNVSRLNGPRECRRIWEIEFLDADANRYSDLARAPTPAAGLSAATGHRPATSVRYRDYLRPNGFGDELRAVLRADGLGWGMVSLFRERGRPAFSPQEAAIVGGLSEPLGSALRRLSRRSRPAGRDVPGPGLALFDTACRLVSLDDAARAWFELIGRDGEELPIVAFSTVIRAQALARRGEPGRARSRIRAASGRWLVCPATCLRTVAGEPGGVALVVEPAKAAEIAPIIVEAFELSLRERQTTELIAQGCSTREIARRLQLSTHTVRDYVKAVFDKVGVKSRGELVAHLWHEHYAPIHLDPSTIREHGARRPG
jgi:DNA-binding CsgD family transcriptional regulator